MARILITDGGPHSPETWAMATAEEIFPIDQNMAGSRMLAASRVQLGIAEALMPHHDNVQIAERAKLAASDDHFDVAHEAVEHAEAAMAAVLKVVKGTPWQDHFNDPEVQQAVCKIVHDHFMTAQHIERLWHADRTGSPQGLAYKARYHGTEG